MISAKTTLCVWISVGEMELVWRLEREAGVVVHRSGALCLDMYINPPQLHMDCADYSLRKRSCKFRFAQLNTLK